MHLVLGVFDHIARFGEDIVTALDVPDIVHAWRGGDGCQRAAGRVKLFLELVAQPVE